MLLLRVGLCSVARAAAALRQPRRRPGCGSPRESTTQRRRSSAARQQRPTARCETAWRAAAAGRRHCGACVRTTAPADVARCCSAAARCACRAGQLQRANAEDGKGGCAGVPMPWGLVKGRCQGGHFEAVPALRPPSVRFAARRSRGDSHRTRARADGGPVRAASALRRPLKGGAFVVGGRRRAGSPLRGVRFRAPQVRRAAPGFLGAVAAGALIFGRSRTGLLRCLLCRTPARSEHADARGACARIGRTAR